MNELRKKRKEKKLTLEDVAKELGTTKSNYYKKECGQIKVSISEAFKLAKIYDTTVDELFFNYKVD